MFLKILIVMGFLFVSAQADACRYKHEDIDTLLKDAKLAFIGVMKTNEMGLAIFNVEKAIRGIEELAEFSTEMGKSSCHIRFEAGQVWLYLGEMLPAGSLLLMDEYGRILEDNAKFAKEKFGYDVAQSPSVVKGKMQNSCAPWDGAAFFVELDNGVNAMVYDTFKEFETGTAVYQINEGVDHAAGGAITVCDRASKKNCRQHTGRLIFGSATPDAASRQIEIDDGEHKVTHIFRVERSTDQAICG